jgi:Kef-type K+ transport system membrane component KefB/nucleotide-binding universal stress UspA family protein
MPVLQPLGEHELFLFFLQFTLLLLVARTMGELALRARLPSVVGELLGGFVIGPSLLGALAPGLFETIFPPNAEQFHLLEIVSWLGVVMLLILTGLETDIGLIVKKGKGAAAISLGGVLVPFATGISLGFLLPDSFLAAPDKRLVFALFLGTAMSISAIPVIAKVLMEMKIIRRDIGQVTLAAGMIDDTIGWILLSVVAGMAAGGSANLATAGQSVLAVVVVLVLAFTVGRRFVSFVIRTLDNLVGGDTIKITALMVLALSFGTITHGLGLEAVLGAFLAGILVGQVKRFDDRLRHIFEQVALGVFAPVFFAASGLRVDLAKLFEPDVLLVGLIVLAVAIGGKFVGAYVGARATRLGHWEALSLGAGMNARGAMEIIVATIGLSRGILTPEMYSIILMVAIVTSLMAPPLLRWTLGHVEMGDEERERLEAEDRRKGSFVGNLKRVLLPTGDERAAQPAAQLVRLMVGDEDVEVTNLALRPERSDAQAAESEETEKVVNHLDSVRRVVKDPDGNRASVILSEAGKGYDLLVMASRARREAGPARLFGDCVEDVVQQSPCPLLVVSSPDGDDGGSHVESPRRILVPVAGSAHDRHAAEVAFSVAREGRSTVELLHVVSEAQHSVRVGADEAVRHAVELGEDLVQGLAELGRSLGVEVETDVVVSDHPERAVVERAGRGADLVVVSSNRRDVTQRAFFGHRIDHILSNAPCTVVVVSAN